MPLATRQHFIEQLEELERQALGALAGGYGRNGVTLQRGW